MWGFFNREKPVELETGLSYLDLRDETKGLIESLPDDHQHKARLKTKLKAMFPKRTYDKEALKVKLQQLHRRITVMTKSV